VVAVRGNMDRGEVAQSLPDTQVVEVGGVLLYILHDIGSLDLSPHAAGFSAVIFGHSHQPEIREEGGVLFFNPGSAGHRRFDYPITLGLLRLRGGRLRPQVVSLDEG
jgi:putative phosphoesterase